MLDSLCRKNTVLIYYSLQSSCLLNGALCLKSMICLLRCDNTDTLKSLAPAATTITEVVSQQERYFDVTLSVCVCVL